MIVLLGLVGDDVLFGGKGDDIFYAGILLANGTLADGDDGADTIDGDGGIGSGIGNDTVDYTAISKAINVTLNGATVTTVTIVDYADDTIVNIENITGGSGNDTIIGDSNNNILRGGIGNDTLAGGAGNDSLYGGTGHDTVDYSGAGKGIVVNLKNAIEVSQDGFDNVDDLDSIEIVVGSAYGDSFTGSDSVDTFVGGAGNDKFFATKGSDTAYGGTIDINGIHSVAGGEYNKADYSDAKKIYVDLGTILNDGTNSYSTVLKSSSSLNDGFGALESTDRLYGFVNIDGTTGADTIIGSSATNFLNGGDGDDKLTGGDGDDNLIGGAGNDTFYATGASDGVDTIDGGTGSDTVDYSILSGANKIVIDLAETADTDATVTVTGGNNDTIRNIENVTGGAGDDTITGNAGDNTLTRWSWS
jgi:Ca2+-binding RTX toxin-like protein